MIDTLFSFYDAGFTIIPENKQNKHPSYKYSDRINSKQQIKFFEIEELYAKHPNDTGYRVGGIKYKNRKPHAQLMCIDIENNKSKLVGGGVIFSDILQKCPEIEEYTYIESTPSGGYHIFYLIPYTNTPEKSRALAFDSNDKDKKLLVELLGINRDGVSIGLRDSDMYKYIGGVESLALLDTVLPQDTLKTMFEVIDSYNKATDIMPGTSDRANLISDSDLILLNDKYTILPFEDFDKSKIALNIVFDNLIKKGYKHITTRDDIALFRHPKSSHSHTLSLHFEYFTIWSYSSSDEIFQPNMVYTMSEAYSLLFHKGDMLATADEVFDKYKCGSRSGIPSEFKFFELVTTKKGSGYNCTINAEQYRRFLTHIGYISIKTKGGRLISKVDKCKITTGYDITEIYKDVFKHIQETFPSKGSENKYRAIKSALLTSRLYTTPPFYEHLDSYDIDDLKIRSTFSVAKIPFRDYLVEIHRDKPFEMKIRHYDRMSKYVMIDDLIQFDIMNGEYVKDGETMPLKLPKNFNLTNFIFDINSNSYERAVSCLTAIGYLLYDFKEIATAKAVMLLDEQTDEHNLQKYKAGRTGKSMLMTFIREFLGNKKYQVVDGVGVRDGDKFSFGNITEHTSVLGIDDVNNSYSVNNLYTKITGDMEIRRMYTQPYVLEFLNAPKIVLSTNFTLVDKSPSTLNRIFPVVLGTTFSDTYTPYQKYGEYFYKTYSPHWSDEKQKKLYLLGLFAIGTYLSFGARCEIGLVKLIHRVDTTHQYPELREYILETITEEAKTVKFTEENNYLYFKTPINLGSVKTVIGKYKIECSGEYGEFKKYSHIRTNLFRYISDFNIKFTYDRSSKGYEIKIWGVPLDLKYILTKSDKQEVEGEF